MGIFDHINKQVALIIFVVLVFFAVLLFFYFKEDTGGAQDSFVAETSGVELGATLGRDMLTALAQLKSTKLDSSIFEDPVFNALKDFSIEIAPQPVGRRNPFAELDSSASSDKANFSSKKATNSSISPTKSPIPKNDAGFELK